MKTYVQATFRLSPQIYARVKEAARVEGHSVNSYVEQAMLVAACKTELGAKRETARQS